MMKLGVATKYKVEYKFYDFVNEEQFLLNEIFWKLSILFKDPQYFNEDSEPIYSENLELDKDFLAECINFIKDTSKYNEEYPIMCADIKDKIIKVFKNEIGFAKFCQNLLNNAEPNLETVILTWI